MTTMQVSDPYCQHLVDPNPWAVALSVFLVLGILLSYLPQHFKIINSGTSAGLSPWWVMLGTLSSIAGLANIITLPTTQHDMSCCHEITGGECAAAMLGVVQVGVQWTNFMTIMVLFVLYFPRSTDLSQSQTLPDGVQDEMPRPHDAVVVAVSCLVALLFAGVGSLFFIVAIPKYLIGWANFLGLSASLMASVQYLPQIWTTWRLGQTLSLSILTMIIQVPGAFVFAFSLWLRVSWQGWSTWLVYIVTAFLQSILLFMAIRFWLRDRNAESADDADGIYDGEASYRPPTERDPLLIRTSDWDDRPDNANTLRTINGSNTPRTPIDSLYRPSPSDNSSNDEDESEDDGQRLRMPKNDRLR